MSKMFIDEMWSTDLVHVKINQQPVLSLTLDRNKNINFTFKILIYNTNNVNTFKHGWIFGVVRYRLIYRDRTEPD